MNHRPGSNTPSRRSGCTKCRAACPRSSLSAYVLEACDAANNCVAEKIVVTVGVAASNQPNVSARNFALIIGNDTYDHLPDLKTAVAVATAVAEVLTRRYAFDRDRVKLLLGVIMTSLSCVSLYQQCR